MNKNLESKICIYPSAHKFGGSVIAPPSKSYAHRLIIAGALSDRSIIIKNISQSDDINATIDVLRKMGAKISWQRKNFADTDKKNSNRVNTNNNNEKCINIHNKDCININNKNSITIHDKYNVINSCDVLIEKNNFLENLVKLEDNTEFFCNQSGSTLRFCIPLALLSDKTVYFSGEGRLNNRPIYPYFSVFEDMGVKWEYNNKLPLKLKGKLKSGDYKISGDISSQFITGLLMALPLCEGDSTIKLTSDLESYSYVDMTIDFLNRFGINIEKTSYNEYKIIGNQIYKLGVSPYEKSTVIKENLQNQETLQNQKILKNQEMVDNTYIAKKNIIYKNVDIIENEGDYSQSAFWAVAGAIGKNPIKIQNITKNTLQGDAVIFDILEDMGVNIKWGDNCVTVFSSNIKNIDINVKNCPDLVPILAVLGTAGDGVMRITNAHRLRYKESDRLNAIATELNSIGADIIEVEDGLIINGVLKNGIDKLKGGQVNSHFDHRIAMSLAIAGNLCDKPIIINYANCVNKSYPKFFEVYKSLGGVLEVL